MLLSPDSSRKRGIKIQSPTPMTLDDTRRVIRAVVHPISVKYTHDKLSEFFDVFPNVTIKTIRVVVI